MNTDISYAITDLRDVELKYKLYPVAVVIRVPKGIAVQALNERGIVIDLSNVPDDEVPVEDDEANGRLLVHTETGTMVLEKLTLANWRSSVLPLHGNMGQVFSRDREVNEYYYRYIRGSE